MNQITKVISELALPKEKVVALTQAIKDETPILVTMGLTELGYKVDEANANNKREAHITVEYDCVSKKDPKIKTSKKTTVYINLQTIRKYVHTSLLKYEIGDRRHDGGKQYSGRTYPKVMLLNCLANYIDNKAFDEAMKGI